jgi:protein-S-isoprenylcysteine O-methyltransferase Ste14
MVVVGQLINLMTYGVLTKRDKLVTSGPYAWCRNPFYVGTLLSDFGFCVMCDPTRIRTLIITLGYALVQGSFFYIQMLKEEKLLCELHGEEYEAYRKRTRWRLLPSLVSAIRYGGFSFKWSARLALHNKIFSRALSAGFWIIAFWGLSIITNTNGEQSYILAIWGLNFVGVLTDPWLMLTACAITAVYILFRIVEKRNRQREEEEQKKTDTPDAESASGQTDTDMPKVSEA